MQAILNDNCHLLCYDEHLMQDHIKIKVLKDIYINKCFPFNTYTTFMATVDNRHQNNRQNRYKFT
jgi:hypothetical protein